MSPVTNFNIGVLGLNHKTSPLETRESLSFSSSEREDALKKLKTLFPSNEYVILSTCNRVELYIASVEEIIFDDVIIFLSSYHNIPKENIVPFIYAYRGSEAITHLFEVASGIDSLVVGETQILAQMKMSYQKALELGSTGKVLNTAFQRAFAVGKKVRSQTGIGDGDVSISSVSCQLAVKVLKGLLGKKILLIGTGKIGTLTLKALHQRGAHTVLVSSRNYIKAKTLAEEFGGIAVRFEELESFMQDADVVISATSAPHHVINLDMFKRVMEKRNREIVLIDLALPRDIDPMIEGICGTHLYNIDSLKSIAWENMKKRQNEIFRCREIIRNQTEFFIKRRICRIEGKDDRCGKTIAKRGEAPIRAPLQKEQSPCYSMESRIQM